MLNDTSLLCDIISIGAERISAGSNALTVTNPATGKVIGRVPRLGSSEAERAIILAEHSQKAWAARSAKLRSDTLKLWSDLIVKNADDLARILTLEQGKPLTEARDEILYGASYVEWYAQEARRVYGETIPSPWSDKRMIVLKQPIGVVAAITPWNFPNAMILRKAAPALAAGCTMVVKPAEQTPFSAIALALLAERAGVPAGVFTVITGDAQKIGGAMTASAVVRKLSFTGSTTVGKELMRQCAGTVKKLSLELGGNAPFIVFDDADLDAAVEGAIVAKFRNIGQTCVCANRLYVQSGIHDAFVTALTARLQAMIVGDGQMTKTDFGPLIDDRALRKVEAQIAEAIERGALVVLGGQRDVLGRTFFQPTVLTGVKQEMRIAREETFGPVAPIFKFNTEAEVTEWANDTEFGLAAYFFTRDLARLWRLGERLEYGMVGINTGAISTAEAPFGGIKQSGIGREGSRHGLEEYLEAKYLCIGEIN
ncbi:NAD-dependent succinate-semialdehyde dehydrogenase [uncultured Aliiroseovarius sp.]|uniref:NAD-dependent succinate-semialdehyde dehydrogenase n=1 Tax=uncultured Aliiroseovarius sp. TaxID=1658783 RepID=UPI002593BE3B|nr:NAD-dependent succinate-semialdehyde dehydrogenase [uncultured Aliiroseovarius sp.]